MEDNQVTLEGAVCPVPLPHKSKVVLGHGSGGKMMFDLIHDHFLPSFHNETIAAGNDAAVIAFDPGKKLVVSTDAHVVSPLFFPGGDIGRLAICGTVNDIAMMGAEPLYLTAGFILEEGLPIDTLARVVESMSQAATEAGISIIAGDTKVVETGKADGLYITTAGVGAVDPGLTIGGAQAIPGDQVILSGPMGDHGIAVLSARGNLGLEAEVQSDVAPLNGMVSALVKACPQVHVLRDPTRGGVATTLNEIVRQSKVGIILDEAAMPIRPPVKAACEVLGFDPLYVANEGKLIAILPAAGADAGLAAICAAPYGSEAIIIGEVVDNPSGRVLMKTGYGSMRIVDQLSGEMLPRIC